MTKLALLALLLAALALSGFAQPQFQTITGPEFNASVPDTISIEGKDLRLDKRNTVLVQAPSGARAFLAIQDGTGYGSDVARRQRYFGLIAALGDGLRIAGKAIPAGNYSFSWQRPAQGEEGDGTFALFDDAGAKVVEASTKRDDSLATPKPLQVIALKNGTARLYCGRHSVPLR